MDYLDLLIIVLLISAGFAGYRRGISWVSFALIGLLIGLLVGTSVAHAVADRFASSEAGNKGLIGFGVFVSVVMVFEGIGTAIGFRVRTATLARRHARLTEVDSLAGSVAAVIGATIAIWFLGIVFGGTNLGAKQISGSFIEQSLARIDPNVPGFLAPLRQILQGTEFPIAFGNGFASSPAQVTLPTDVNTPGIRTATLSSVRVLSFGCGIEAGSAWSVSSGYYVTNAHVVAGAQRVILQRQGVQGDSPATVVFYDPEIDVAVLHSTLVTTPLPLAADDPRPGTAGAVIGYPGGGDETEVPAAVRGIETASGFDIYSAHEVTRSIEVLNALVQPGNSGGAVVDRNGTVVGLVFAVSTTDETEGYALAVSQIRPDITAGVGRTQAVDTQGCAS